MECVCHVSTVCSLSFNIMDRILNIIKHILNIVLFAYISGRIWEFKKFVLAPVSEQADSQNLVSLSI